MAIGKKALKELKASKCGARAINVLRVASAVAAATTVTIGSDVYEVNVGNGITAGRYSVDVSTGGTKSVGTLTQTANPAADETVVIGATTYTFKTSLTGAANQILIGADCAASIANLVAAIMAAAGSGTTYGAGTVVNAGATAVVATGVKATGTLTSDATAPSDGDTVTIDGKVYTFKTTLTPTEGQVLIGGSAAVALDNLKAAINHTGTPDTDYKCAAAHTSVTATTNTNTTQVIEALVAGGAGNLLATTENGTHTSFGAATLTGGSDKVTVTARYTGLGGDLIATTETLGSGSFGGATLASGADPTAAQFSAAFETAVNARANVVGAKKISNNEVMIFTIAAGNFTIACTETLAGSNNVWQSATMFGGFSPALDVERKSVMLTRVPGAQEVTLGNMHFALPFTPTQAIVQVVTTSTGVQKVWDGARIYATNRLTLDNSGSTDWAATDTLVVIASE